MLWWSGCPIPATASTWPPSYRPGQHPTLEELDAHCRSRLAGYKVPRQLDLVDEIVRQPSGKPDYPWAKRVATGAR